MNIEKDSTHEKKMQELKKELKESKEYISSDEKVKDKIMKKINELNNLNKKYEEQKNNRTKNKEKRKIIE